LAAGFHPEVEQSRQRCRQSSRSPGLDSLIEPVRNRLPSAALVAGALSLGRSFSSLAASAAISRRALTIAKISVYAPNMTASGINFADTQQCACSAARRKSRELTRFYEHSMRGSGLRAAQFTLLATLIQTGPMPATRLADFLGLDRTTLTRNLRPLHRDGHVTIEDGADRRVHKVSITAKGAEAAERAYPAWRRAQDAALARPWMG
jgi:DNA-binding MarR family transcriptional regulator